MPPMINIMFILIVIISYIVISLGLGRHIQSQHCYNASDCVGTAWVSPDNLTIYGHGYRSLYGTNTSVTINTVYCNGAFACTDISFISNHYYVYCLGTHSCANIDGLSYIEAKFVFCRATNACQNSNIRANIKIYCDGSQSCIYSNISSPNVYAHAFHSLYQATVISNGTLNVYLNAYQSGFGATIICKTDDTCNIYCYYNGCEMLYLECEDGSNCNIILNNNDPTITIPPIQNMNEYNNNLYNIKYYSNTQSLTNNGLCSNAVNLVYDNYMERQGIIAINEQNAGPVCCRGDGACSNADSIVFTDSVSDIVVCSGYQSCIFNISKGITINTANHVYCEGWFACHNAIINKADSVYCVSEMACDGSIIRESKNIYCFGNQACLFDDIISNGNDINAYFLGTESGLGVRIFCNIGDKCEIKCGGFDSCYFLRLWCNNNCIVECNADTGCPEGDYTETANPTQIPTQNPTQNPIQKPTQQPTSLENSSVAVQNTILIIVIVSLGFSVYG